MDVCDCSLRDSKIPTDESPCGKLSFIITGDEEGEAINGTPQIMEWTKKNNIKIDHCLVGEPTSNSSIGDRLK